MNNSKGKELVKAITNGNIDAKKLNSYSSFARIHNNHLFYEKAICTYDKTVSFDRYGSFNKKFIGNGSGTGSLDSYRKIQNQDYKYFEKVYFNGEIQLEKILLFDDLIKKNDYPLNTPKINDIIYGNKLTVVYFEWINVQSIEKSLTRTLNSYVNTKCDLKLLEKNEYVPSILLIDKSINYKRAKKKAINWIKNNLPINKVEKNRENILEIFLKKSHTVENSNKLHISHGDFHYKNILRNDFILDWDEWGYYPTGYDLAKLLSMFKFKNVNQIKNILKEKSISIYSDNNFWYLLLIFSCHSQNYVKHSDSYLKKLLHKSLQEQD